MAKEKELSVYDATKEELIQYFFHPIDGGFRIPSGVDRFLIWLKQKRTGELIDAQSQTAEESQKALHEYIDYVKQANAEQDIAQHKIQESNAQAEGNPPSRKRRRIHRNLHDDVRYRTSQRQTAHGDIQPVRSPPR